MDDSLARIGRQTPDYLGQGSWPYSLPRAGGGFTSHPSDRAQNLGTLKQSWNIISLFQYLLHTLYLSILTNPVQGIIPLMRAEGADDSGQKCLIGLRGKQKKKSGGV